MLVSPGADWDPRAALAMLPAVVLVSLDAPDHGLAVVAALQAGACPAPILVFCSRYWLPGVQELVANGVRGIVSSDGSVQELADALLALATGAADPLPLQYVRAGRVAAAGGGASLLSDREQEILQLVAEDLTDQQIAQHLQLSPATVHNHLRHIYAKLGVRGRGGAITVAAARRIVRVEQLS